MSVRLDAPLPEDQWTRDVATMIVGWLLGTIVAVVLIFTVVRGLFL